MYKKNEILHIALQYNDTKKADIFFKKILGLKMEREFNISEELSDKIFGIKENIDVKLYGNDDIKFEVFISKKDKKNNFEHVCIKIGDKEKFIKICKQNNIEPMYIKKGEKTLLFIRDHSNNLYEIK